MRRPLKDIVPPIILRAYKSLSRKYGFFGNYKTWEDAKKETTGYDDAKILEKVKNSLLKVKNREAVYERDSVLFDKVEYSWPLLACLLYVASRKNNEISVLDFGGSLGSSYYQNIRFLAHLKKISWNVVEQENFVRAGRETFQNNQLKFFDTIEESILNSKPDVLLLASVVQYLEKPYEFLEKITGYNIPYLIFDRTTFMKQRGQERLAIQKVHPRVYPASYPVWFLDVDKFKKIFEGKYDLIEEFDSLSLGLPETTDNGFFFKKHNEI